MRNSPSKLGRFGIFFINMNWIMITDNISPIINHSLSYFFGYWFKFHHENLYMEKPPQIQVQNPIWVVQFARYPKFYGLLDIEQIELPRLGFEPEFAVLSPLAGAPVFICP